MKRFTICCPHCGAQFTIKHSKYVGKKVRCRHCREPFRVQVPDSEPAEHDSPLASALEDEAADPEYGGPLPPRVGASASRSRRTQDARRGRSRAKSDQTDWTKPALISGSVAAVVLIVVVCFFLWPGGPHEEPVPQPEAEPTAEAPVEAPAAGPIASLNLAYLPPDAELIVAVRVADLWNAPLVQKLVEDMGPEGKQTLDQMQQDTGLTPADVESVIFATPSLSDLFSMGMSSVTEFGPMDVPPDFDVDGPGEQPTESDEQTDVFEESSPAIPATGLAVIRTRKPYDQQKLLKLFAEDGKSESVAHKGKTYHRVTFADPSEPLSVYFAADRTIVVGPDEEVRKAISRGDRSVPLPPALRALNPDSHVAVALLPSEETREQFKSGGMLPGMEDTDPQDETTDPVSKLMEESVTGLGLSLQVSDALTVQVLLPCKTSAAAQQLSAAVQEQLRQARSDFAEQKESLPPALFQPLEQALASVKPSQHDDVVELAGTVPAKFFEPDTLASLPMLLMPLMMGGMMADIEEGDFETTSTPPGQSETPFGRAEEQPAGGASREAGRVKLEKPENHGGFAFAIAPDGKTVAGGTGIVTMTVFGKTSVSGGDVLLWDAATGKLKKTLGKHGASVTWLAYSHDGHTLASASKENGVIKLWDAGAGRLKQTLTLKASYASGGGFFPLLILSPDGRTLVTVIEKVIKVGKSTISEAGDVIVWDTQTGKVKWTVPDSNLKALALSPDGNTLAGYVQVVHWREGKDGDARGESGERQMSLWDLQTGKVRRTFDPGKSSQPNALVFPPDGNTLVGLTHQGLIVWDPNTGTEKETIQWDHERWSCSAFAYSADGQTLARAATKWVELCDVQTGSVTGLLTTEFPDMMWGHAFSADLKRMACTREHEPVVMDLTGLERVPSASSAAAGVSKNAVTPSVRRSSSTPKAVEFGVGLSGSPKARAAAAEAAKEAAAALGDRKAKAVIVFHGKELAGDYAKVLEGVASVFDPSIVYGCSGHAPLGHQSHEGTVGVLAIGGDVEVTAAVAGTSGKDDDIECGQRIGRALKKAAGTDAAGKLLLLFGDCHVPRNNDLVRGVSKVLGENFPIVGGAAFEGTIYVRGKRLEKTNVGLLLSGDFKCGLSLKQDNSNEGLATSARDAVKEAIGQDKEKTIFVFVFDCGGRRGKMIKNGNFPAELAAMKEAAGEIPLFGFYGSGEIGQKDNNTAPCGVGYHISTCAISTK